MGFRAAIIRPFAKNIARSIDRWAAEAVVRQEKIFQNLISRAANTAFGRDHNFLKIKTYDDFRQAAPLRDYEDLKNYVERIKNGERDVLWPGVPAYFAKTSGTTSGVKYIPMSRESTPLHFGTARNATFNYFARTGNGRWLDGNFVKSSEPEHSGLPNSP